MVLLSAGSCPDVLGAGRTTMDSDGPGGCLRRGDGRGPGQEHRGAAPVLGLMVRTFEGLRVPRGRSRRPTLSEVDPGWMGSWRGVPAPGRRACPDCGGRG